MSKVQNKIFVICFLLLPIIFTISNSLADIIISIIAIYGIYKFATEKKEYKELFSLIFITILYLSVIALFSENKFNSFHSSFLLVRFPFFLFGILKLNQVQNVQMESVSLYLYVTILVISIIIIFEWLFIDSYRPAGPFNWSLKGNLSEHKEFVAGNFLSKFFLISLACVWYLKIINNVNLKFYLIGISLFVISLAIFFTQERTAFLFAIILIFSAFFTNLRKIINFKLIFYLIIPFMLLLGFYSSGFVKERMVINTINQLKFENGEFNYFNTSRGKNHQYAIEVWKEYPIFGVGLENFETKCKEMKLDERDINCANYTFNIYTDILAEAGLVGLILFLLFFYFIIKINILYYKFNSSNYIQISSFLTYLCIIFPFLPSYAFFSQNYMILFWIIISINIISIQNGK